MTSRAARAALLGVVLGLFGCKGATSDDCQKGSTACGSKCVALSEDNLHCGSCGTACAAGQVCSRGNCELTCGTGLTDCSGSCRDLSGDRANCGACGTACADGQVCSAGVCVLSCEQALTDCSGSCRDLAHDESNCGACGHLCPAGDICSGGMCTLTCQAGLTACNGVCRDLHSDNMNCGTCGTACGAGYACSGGSCLVTCASGQTNCAGTCRTLASDAQNCGACGHACGAGQFCVSGYCQSDSCDSAPAITLLSGTTTIAGNSTGMTPSGLGCGGGPDVYYKFTLTAREVVYADTYGTGWDTRIGFASSCTAAATSCNDDSCGTVQSQAVAVFNPGTYYVVVGGYWSGNAGPFTLHLQHVPVSTGGGVALPTSFSMAGTTVGSTSAQSSCSGNGPDVWYYYLTCPTAAAGSISANLCNTSTAFDTVLAFRNGSDGSGACNDDGGGTTCGLRSSLAATSTGGAGVHVLYVDTFGSGTGGPYLVTGTHP